MGNHKGLIQEPIETLTPFDRSFRAAMVDANRFSSESIILSANRVTSHIFENDRFGARYWSMAQSLLGFSYEKRFLRENSGNPPKSPWKRAFFKNPWGGVHG